MLLANMASTVIVLILLALIILVNVFFMFVFGRYFRLWLKAFMSGTPLSILEILGMQFRRIDANAVVQALIMARQAGVELSCHQMERAYLQGVDLEKLTLAIIQASKQDKDVTVEELVEADLEDRLAEKLGLQVGSVSEMTTARADGSMARESGDQPVRICRKCSKKVFDDSKICRNCGAIL